MSKPVKKLPPAECSAKIVDGRLACDCLAGKKEIRADIAVCYPKMQTLMEEMAKLQAAATPAPAQ